MKAIKEAAHTDKIGDGKIFVLDLVQAVRIRTGETGKPRSEACIREINYDITTCNQITGQPHADRHIRACPCQ